MKKFGYFLCLFIFANMLFPAKLAVLPGHITPQKLCMDDRQIYIAEGPEVLNWYKTNPSTSFEYDEWKRVIKFPDYFPAVRDLFTDDEKIYIMTYKETKQGTEFFVFDPGGKFIKEVFLPVKKSNLKGVYPYYYDSCPFAFRKGKFYRLIENEDTEEWELHVHEVINQ